MPQAPTVLVVDDDEYVREYAVEALRNAGFEAVAAGSAPEALAALEEHDQITLLFTDIVMPGIDGYMLADMVTTRWPGIKVVYATGYADIARSLPGIRHGPMLDKPYRSTALLEAIATVMRRPL